jgi:GNAT superfamily N-acetyltransferase
MSKALYDLDSGVPGVRLAIKADELQLFGLLMLLHAENGMFGLNRDKVIQGIQWATERKGGIIFCIDDNTGPAPGVVASLGMCITCDWYSDDEYLLERWNYVHPEYRRKDYARKLIEQSKWAHHWFKRQGILLPFQCGINSFDRTEAKVRMYARHMPCIGAYFMYGLPPLQAEKARAEMARIDELNKLVSWRKVEPTKVRPLVETIIRTSQRTQRTKEEEPEHVQ